MIEELTTYMKGIQEQFPLKDFIIEPTTGLHIMFELVDDEIQLYKKELYIPKPKETGNPSKFLIQECLPRELNSSFIKSAKAIRGQRGAKVRSASPFLVSFYKESLVNKWKDWLSAEDKKENKASLEKIKELEKQVRNISDKKIKKEENKTIFKLKIELILKRIEEYLQLYFIDVNDYLFLNDDDLENVLKYQSHLIRNIGEVLSSFYDEIEQLRVSQKDLVIIYFKDIGIKQYEESYKAYLEDKIFNTTASKNRNLGDQVYGISEFKNSFNSKKPYLQHKTAPFNLNLRIGKDKAVFLEYFTRYRKAKVFKTSPLPIFIDYPELNETVVNVIKKEGNDVKFNTILKKIYEERNADLGNYYLFFIDYKGEVKDLDFVSSFSFKLDLKITSIFPKPNAARGLTVRNVFQFEIVVLKEIFSNQLIQRRKDESFSYRYFEEIDNNPKYITQTQWHLVMKYRKAFYDWIYKSRRQAVTNVMFHDIMLKGTLDDIRRDEYKNGEHTKHFNILNKLNIWFSLWDSFKQTNTSNQLIMANKIVTLQERMRLLRENNEEHIETAEELAFTIGQVIYFLLSKSKAGNKSHSLLEPFIQKTNNEELKKALVSTFNAYKHEISFGKGRFEKLFGEIMGYEFKGDLKKLTPLILAGYFSDCTIYEAKENNDN